MKFLIDNNLSPFLARALNELSRREPPPSIDVFALRDRFAPHTKDEVWLAALVESGEEWNVVSADSFRKTDAEKELIRSAGFNVFVLQRSWAKQQYWSQAAQLVLWWPKIIAQAKTVRRSAYRVPWRTAGKFEQIRL